MDEELSAMTGTGRKSPGPHLPLQRATRAQLERIGEEFLVEILSREVRRQPTNALALSELAHVYTRIGRLDDGLQADLALARLVPEDPTVHYNLACSYALLGHIDSALDALERSVDLGYDDADHLTQDEDLLTLRTDPRFLSIVRSLESDNLPPL